MATKDCEIKTHAPLSKCTTWRVGGPAEFLAEPKSIEEIEYLISWASSESIDCKVIGAGSNLLINDSGLSGLIICLKKFQGSKIDSNSGLVEALGGEPIPTLSRLAAKNGLHGLEWAIGIPGTVGGAAVMNAGAQGFCIEDWIQSVKVISLQGGSHFELEKKDLAFSYRNSLLQKEKLLVLSARFLLDPGHNPEKLNKITSENLNKRIKTQPYDFPSCGSVFRNPEPLKAGAIIESLGLKGHQIGDAEISRIHANFIINNGKATAQDIHQLISFVQQRVLDSHGLLLQPEVKQLGFLQTSNAP